MKYIFLVFFCFPAVCLAQNRVEEVQLKSGKTAVLYDNGLWVYKDVPANDFKQIPARVYQQASPSTKSSTPQTSSPCGARTKTTGAPCKRLVKGGGYCYQHA